MCLAKEIKMLINLLVIVSIVSVVINAYEGNKEVRKFYPRNGIMSKDINTN